MVTPAVDDRYLNIFSEDLTRKSPLVGYSEDIHFILKTSPVHLTTGHFSFREKSLHFCLQALHPAAPGYLNGPSLRFNVTSPFLFLQLTQTVKMRHLHRLFRAGYRAVQNEGLRSFSWTQVDAVSERPSTEGLPPLTLL